MAETSMSVIIETVDDMQYFGDKGFRVRELYCREVRGDGRHNPLKLKSFNDLADELGEINNGDRVHVRIDLQGRIWEKKEDNKEYHFLDLVILEFKVMAKNPLAIRSKGGPENYKVKDMNVDDQFEGEAGEKEQEKKDLTEFPYPTETNDDDLPF